MKIHGILTAVLAASLLTLVPSGPVIAVTHADTWAHDVTVRYDNCKTTQVQARGDWGLDTYNEITVDVYDVDGAWFYGDYFYDDVDGSVRVPVMLCGWDKEGTYTIEVEAVDYDDFGEQTVQHAGATFTYAHIGKGNVRISREVYKRPNRHYKHRVPGRVFRNGEPYVGARVRAEVRIDGSWYVVDRQATNKRGRFGWKFMPNRFVWRYVFAGDDGAQHGKSEKFRTPFRGGGRATVTARDLSPLLKRR
jgi:hypothetical protein